MGGCSGSLSGAPAAAVPAWHLSAASIWGKGKPLALEDGAALAGLPTMAGAEHPPAGSKRKLWGMMGQLSPG